MRLILVDREDAASKGAVGSASASSGAGSKRRNFYPLALSRPVWELRCGMTSLAEKLIAAVRPSDVACFLPSYLAEAYRRRTDWPVNDPRTFGGDHLMIVDARVKASALTWAPTGPSQVALDEDGEFLAARVHRNDTSMLRTDSIEAVLDSIGALPLAAGPKLPTWNYTWDLVLANAEELTADFDAAGRSGIEGTVEDPFAVRGDRKNLFVSPGAKIHPMVVLDVEKGPIYIDEEAVLHPFTRIEGPCYVGRQCVLLRANCRGGNSFGTASRIGGEVEGSIIHGFSNKYHDGFLGHAYLGAWVNLGAQTTNSDLKNDYTEVAVSLDGRTMTGTGSTKAGALIGDHAKTAIGTLLNTGAYIGAMALVVGGGKLLPKFIPSFTWYLEGSMNEGTGKERAYSTAKTVLSRRGRDWTAVDEALWNRIHEMTAADRDDAIARNQRQKK